MSKKANSSLKSLGVLTMAGLLASAVPAQTSQQLYNDLTHKGTTKEIVVPELKSSLTTLSTPTWTVVKPTDRGLAADILNSVYFDATDSTFVIGGAGGMTKKDTTVHGYGYLGDMATCFPVMSNGFASYKIGDTIYRGTQSNGGIGGLVMQLADGTWCNLNTNFTTTINSINKFQNKLYVGTGQGIFVYGPNGVLLQQYTTTNSSLPSNSINKLVPDAQGNLWIATQGGGLVKFDGTNWTIYNATTTGLPNFNFPKDVTIDNAGNVWAGNTKLFCFSGGVWSEVTVPTVATGSLEIKGLEVDQYGNLILATKNNGIRILDAGTGLWRTYDTANSPLTTNRVNDVAVNKTDPNMIDIGIASDASGFIELKESTADYLPQIPTDATITGQDTIVPGQSYTYALSTPTTPITNAQHYDWFYTGTGIVSMTPSADGKAITVTFASNASDISLGDIVSVPKNNYVIPGVVPLQLSFSIVAIDTGVGIQETPAPQEKIKAGPNPVTGDVFHVFDLNKKNIKFVKIYSTTGELKRGKEINSEESLDIDVSGFKQGIYVIELEDKNGNDVSSKFMKK